MIEIREATLADADPIIAMEAVFRRDIARARIIQKLFTATNQSNLPMQHRLESLGYVRSGVILDLDPDDPELV